MNAGLLRTIEYSFLFCIYFIVEAAKEYEQDRATYERKAIENIRKTGLPRS